ncbi:MAG: radical SAM family heme chaperone HemW [Elusimicrobiota bacterium]
MSKRPVGLYVHVPFCAIKCFYCDFAAFSGQKSSVGRYLHALDRESSFYPGVKPSTVYIGGGTPSELSAGELAQFFAMLAMRYGPLAKAKESTFEANPESLDVEKVEVLRRAGVGRLSLGLQTAEDRLLKEVGRKHTWEDFLRVYKLARGNGFSINVDLMLGLPGQSHAQALRSLRLVLELSPDHLSLYCLQVEDRTLFARRQVLEDDGLARRMFDSSIKLLARAGYRHYEISNFSLPGKESLHNLNYWKNGSYLGLGCGAAGYLGGVRYQNEDRLQNYMARVERGESPTVSHERLKGKEKTGEDLMLGLRLLSGVSLTQRMRSQFEAEFEALRRKGLLALSRNPRSGVPARARLTGEGVFFANEVFREFVPPFSPYRRALRPMSAPPPAPALAPVPVATEGPLPATTAVGA